MTNGPKLILDKMYSSFNCVWVCMCVFIQDSEKYVEQLLTLFNRFSKLVKEAFQDDPRFLTARDKVCVMFPKMCALINK